MKAFIVSLCLFLLLVILIAANAVYVHRVTAHVEESLSALSFEDTATAEQLGALDAYWETHRPLLALSIGYRELDRMGELLLSLHADYDQKSAADFERDRRLAADTAAELSRHEQFSLENLF